MFWETTLFTTIDPESQKHLWQPQLHILVTVRMFYKRAVMDTDNCSHKSHTCWMRSQTNTFFIFLFWKSSNDGDAILSLRSLIALQCFTINIMSNLNTLGVWTHDFLSYPELSQWGDDCFFSLFSSLWKCSDLKIIELYKILGWKAPPGNHLIQSPPHSKG